MLPNTYINFQAGTQMGDKLILGGCPPARGNPVKKKHCQCYNDDRYLLILVNNNVTISKHFERFVHK